MSLSAIDRSPILMVGQSPGYFADENFTPKVHVIRRKKLQQKYRASAW